MLKVWEIIKEDNPLLRKTAKEVKMPPSEEDRSILQSMMEYIQCSQDPEISKAFGIRPGIGLAAPQIGFSKRMIVVHLKEKDGGVCSYALFNPKIIEHSEEKSFLSVGEGCLSVDRPIEGYVPRHAEITVSGTNLDGSIEKIRLKGLASICFQHEIDHLNGILFYDRINKQDPFFQPKDAFMIER
ncbi:peptide deformylase [Bacillus massiliglaciei]|uniref:peptide deformylase n=1 Tax=Bacillus massiliglaciei TaxID=1816693 RepID=UPI000B26860C|nr:peptide deformylase [Bacillus massiliglaciei]